MSCIRIGHGERRREHADATGLRILMGGGDR
jgi:hypothetical protein